MIKFLIRIFTGLFPSFFVGRALDKLTNPQIHKLREREIEILNTANKEDISFKGFNIKIYRWEGSNKRVLLIHGWEGQAGNFSDLIIKLRHADYDIFTFDALSHGFSSKGETSFFEFIELVGFFIEKYKIKNLISHSFGGVACTYALFKNQDLEIDKYALITTPDKFSERINDVAIQYGIDRKVIRKLVIKLEQDYNIEVEKLCVSEFVKDIKVKSALIIHDKNDKVIPIERSRNVHHNWKQSRFKEVEGTGHFRILRDEKVLDLVIEFIES